ncbi:uncharacterized protein LOC126894791 [Daktulosphaira vitifoliae]|uniref:uncharacterized protein LOC126894791 n=1 Tax=Daktulosphaira vitifoliae TaxID=58002 RepID=UPI0021AACEBC|nr:uncharacterized protein LOC126894791 [Daktulosphaira vitifoliae]
MMQEYINQTKNANGNINNSSFMASTFCNRMRLAPPKLPSFNGNIEEWESFYNVFCSMVHSKDYDPVEKFCHLRSALSGSAAEIIKSIPLTDENYEVALRKLKKRYKNKALIIQSHIKALLNSPRITNASASSLEKLHSHVEGNLSALEVLNEPVDQWDSWLVTIILGCLDEATSHEWQNRQTTTDMPKYKNLEQFLAGRCALFETSEAWDNCGVETRKGIGRHAANRKITLATAMGGEVCSTKGSLVKSVACPVCNGLHKIYACAQFKSKTPSERLTITRNLKLYFNCFSNMHTVAQCNGGTCRVYNRKHNFLLHFPITSSQNSSESKNEVSATSEEQEIGPVTALCNKEAHSEILLATALVKVMDSTGNCHHLRAMLDSGSQINIISKRTAHKLNLITKKGVLSIRGVGEVRTNSAFRTTIEIQSLYSQRSWMLDCQVVDQVLNLLPNNHISTETWRIPEDIQLQLADPNFMKPGPIDLLIGAEIFFDMLETEKREITVDY